MINTTAISCLIVGGLFSSYIIARPYRSVRLSRRLLKIVQSTEVASKERGCFSDEVIQQFIHTTKGLAILVPAIASGELGDFLSHAVSEDDPSSSQVWEYLDANNWFAPYYFAAMACFADAVSIYNPISRKHWRLYCWSWISLTFFSRKDGSLSVTRELDPEYVNTVRIAEEKFKSKKLVSTRTSFAH
jgi:hypothetical protein